jgi:hypothetical protein
MTAWNMRCLSRCIFVTSAPIGRRKCELIRRLPFFDGQASRRVSTKPSAAQGTRPCRTKTAEATSRLGGQVPSPGGGVIRGRACYRARAAKTDKPRKQAMGRPRLRGAPARNVRSAGNSCETAPQYRPTCKIDVGGSAKRKCHVHWSHLQHESVSCASARTLRQRTDVCASARFVHRLLDPERLEQGITHD